MLIFAKDISQRDFIHSAEDQDPEIKKYMDYQRWQTENAQGKCVGGYHAPQYF